MILIIYKRQIVIFPLFLYLWHILFLKDHYLIKSKHFYKLLIKYQI